MILIVPLAVTSTGDLYMDGNRSPGQRKPRSGPQDWRMGSKNPGDCAFAKCRWKKTWNQSLVNVKRCNLYGTKSTIMVKSSMPKVLVCIMRINRPPFSDRTWLLNCGGEKYQNARRERVMSGGPQVHRVGPLANSGALQASCHPTRAWPSSHA